MPMLPKLPVKELKVVIHWFLIWLSTTAGAVIISLMIHTGGAVVAWNLVMDSPGGAGRPDGSGDIELAVVTDTELTELQDDTVALTPSSLQATSEMEFEGGFEPPTFQAAVTDVTVLGDELGEIAPMGGAGEGLDESAMLGAGVGSGGASFFGVEARGSRFAYIVDISGSMSGKKLAALQRELSRSIEGLLEHSSFAVVFYSSTSRILGGRLRWMRATQRHKTLADREIRALTEGGGTQPTEAFEIAFGLKPRPDAIYFMTDGLFPSSVAAYVSQANESAGEVVPVHCISFVSRESERLLRSIAERSGGTYTHIPAPEVAP